MTATGTGPSATERAPGWRRRSGPVVVVASGLVTLVALVALPLTSAADDGAVTGPELAAGAGDVGWALAGLGVLAVVAVVVAGTWLLVSSPPPPLRRAGVLAVVVVAGLLVAAAAGLAVVQRPSSGWWLAVLGLLGAGAGALVERAATTGSAGPSGPARGGVGPVLAGAVLVVLVAGTVLLVPRQGTTWSAGLWAWTRTPTASASCQLPANKDAYGAGITYDASNAVDGRIDTAWRCDGDGVNRELRVDLGRWRSITRAGLVPGYLKTDPSDGTDRYAQNRRISAVRYTFDGGLAVEQRFDTAVSARSLQSVAVPAVQSRHVTITILGSVDGTKVGTQDARQVVAISEVVFT